MRILNDLKTIPQFWKMSLLSTISLRTAFLMQSVMLMVSNIIFFSFWWIYFYNFPSLKGWKIEDLALLYGIVSASYGFVSVFFGGSRYIARLIFEGDLDMMIVKPRPIILQLIAIKSVPSGWGDFASSLIMFWLSGYCKIETCPLLLLTILFSSFVILAFSILLGSLAFWLGNCHQLSKQIFEFLLTFSNYPESIYTGFVKLFLFTLIPSAFIGFIPVNIVRDFSITSILGLGLFSVFYLAIAIYVFHLGLKNYTSGNRMGFRI